MRFGNLGIRLASLNNRSTTRLAAVGFEETVRLYDISQMRLVARLPAP